MEVCVYMHSVTLSSLSAETLVEARVIHLQGFRKGKRCFGEGGGLDGDLC